MNGKPSIDLKKEELRLWSNYTHMALGKISIPRVDHSEEIIAAATEYHKGDKK